MRRSSAASRVLAAVAALAFAAAAPSHAASLEAAVKAAFLFNFARFVEWPASAFPTPSANLVIGVAGDCEVGPVLAQLVRQEVVGGRKLTVKTLASGGIEGCHIVYVCGGAPGNPRRSGVLVVGESTQFLSQGGSIRFYTAENKVRFEVSIANAHAAGLKLSSRLLKVARIVDRPGKGP